MAPTNSRLFAVLLSLLVVASVAIPGAVAGATAEDGDLTLEVTQDKTTGEVHVALTDNGTAAENATIDVYGDAYDGNGTHDLDANGSVVLPEPNATATVTIDAETNDSRNVSGSFDLVPLAESLSVSVNQTEDSVDILVEQYGDAVEGAAVNVTVPDENETYVDNGSYTTDENGTVSLSNPTAPVTIAVEATHNGVTANTTADLSGAGLSVTASQDANYSVIIDVTYDGEAAVGANVTVTGDYAYAGEYTTDANGTIELNPPANDTSINITAEYEGVTAEITDWTIAAEESEGNSGFAKALVRYIEFIKMEDLDVPLGQKVSAFVHANNPASADDDAGPPEHAGPKNSVTATSNQSDSHGPPAWAGPHTNSTEENETAESGPPNTPPGHDKAKGNNGNGNGHGGAPPGQEKKAE